MAKKKTQKPRRIVTKHQLTRWQQQEKRRRIILFLGILVITVIIGTVIAGWYIGQYQPMQQTVIRVNDTEFNMKYYVDTIKFYGGNQTDSYSEYLADQVTETIARNELIRQGASKMEISVSEDDVDEKLESIDLPDNEVLQDLVRNQIIINRLLDEYFEKQVPVSAEQVHLMAMLLESEHQATEVRARLENGESFIRLAEELSLYNLVGIEQGDFGWHPRAIFNDLLDASLVEYAFNTEAGTLSQPKYDEETSKDIGYWLIIVQSRNEEEEEAQVQAMLLGSEAEAWEIRDRLEAGEEFSALAEEFSRLSGVEENKGEYELSPGMASPVFDEFVFNSEVEPGTISEPIRDDTTVTDGGYWLIKVSDKDEDRQIGKDDQDWLKAKALDKWVSSLLEDPENVVDDSYLDAEKKTWALEQAKRG